MVVLSGVSDGLVVQDGGTKRRYGVVQEEVGEEDLEEHEVTLLPGPPTRSLYWSRDNILRSILSHSALEQSLTTSILVIEAAELYRRAYSDEWRCGGSVHLGNLLLSTGGIVAR
eukprot:3573445-Rhodomonas_salina.1